MQWEEHGTTWSPRLHSEAETVEELVSLVVGALGQCDSSPWEIHRKLPFEAVRLRQESLNAIAASSVGRRERAETLAAFGVECTRDEHGDFLDTSLRMVRSGDSAGNGMPAYAQRIVENSTEADIRSTLVDRWRYKDSGSAFRWDPQEYRGYAMQWTDPSKETTVSVRGANRLALAAMPLLPVIPWRNKVETVGFVVHSGRVACFTWPLWSVPASLDVIKSLLTTDILHVAQPDRDALRLRGVTAAFRCDRSMTSKYYRNFTTAHRVA